MDTPRETMDKVIPKKKGLQKKHIGYIAIGIGNCCSDLHGILCRSHINIQG